MLWKRQVKPVWLRGADAHHKSQGEERGFQSLHPRFLEAEERPRPIPRTTALIFIYTTSVLIIVYLNVVGSGQEWFSESHALSQSRSYEDSHDFDRGRPCLATQNPGSCEVTHTQRGMRDRNPPKTTTLSPKGPFSIFSLSDPPSQGVPAIQKGKPQFSELPSRKQDS